MILTRGPTSACEAWVRKEIALSFPISHYWQICERYRQLSVDHGDRTLMHSRGGMNLYHIEPGLRFGDFTTKRACTIPFVHERPPRWGQAYDGLPREPDRAG